MSELRLKSTGTIKLFENDNTSNITIASPASLGADRTITLPDASVTLASGTMLATDGSGASLTALNASELGSGTVPTARLGSGTASSSTVLYGDQTYKAEPGGVNTPIFYVTRALDQAIADATYTKVEWDTEGIDTDSAFASYKFTVPAGAGGIYYFSTGIEFQDNSVQNYHYVLFYKNGSAVSVSSTGMTTSDQNTDRYWQTANMSLTLVATDYVEVFGFCDFESGTGNMASCYFTGFKLVQ